MITRVRETEEARTERRVREWAAEIDAARISGNWSSRLQAMDDALDVHFAQHFTPWDDAELAEIREMTAEAMTPEERAENAELARLLEAA
jgi:hypothetical protein